MSNRSSRGGRHVLGEGSVVGDVVGGHRVTRRLRLRGCAGIYRAIHVDSGVDVVLKTLCLDGPGHVHARMDNETMALLALKGCSSVPSVIGVGSVDDQRYLSSQWLPGKTLRWLSKQATTPVQRARQFLSMAVAACDSLAAVHSAGIVHGDVSRFNLLWHEIHGVGVVDFESAVRLSDGEDELRRKITYAYAPPELSNDDDMLPSIATDVYSLAAVLFRQLSGQRHRLPVGSSVDSRSRGALSSPLRPLDGLAAALWPGLPSIFRRALHLDAAKRYSGVEEFRDDVVGVTR